MNQSGFGRSFFFGAEACLAGGSEGFDCLASLLVVAEHRGAVSPDEVASSENGEDRPKGEACGGVAGKPEEGTGLVVGIEQVVASHLRDEPVFGPLMVVKGLQGGNDFISGLENLGCVLIV